MNYLNEQPEVLSIGAWGNNTGAAALLMYAARKPKVFSFMILDAVYESFEACLTEAMRQTQGSISVPQMMIKMGLKVVMGSVRKKLGAPISTTDISPSKYLPILCMPALFLLPTDDEILTIPMMQVGRE